MQLDERAVTAAAESAELPARYAAHIATAVARELPDPDPDERHRVVASIARQVKAEHDGPGFPPQLLIGIVERNSIGGLALPVPPDVPLSQHDSFVNARCEIRHR